MVNLSSFLSYTKAPRLAPWFVPRLVPWLSIYLHIEYAPWLTREHLASSFMKAPRLVPWLMPGLMPGLAPWLIPLYILIDSLVSQPWRHPRH